MVSTFTPNKNLELPGYNDYVNNWNVPVNADFTAIDTALGGSTQLNATAISGDVTLTSTQYRPPLLIISGTLTANVRYLVPAGVGGQWTVTNSTTGAFTVQIASAAGGSNITLPIGTTIVSCDGTASGMRLSISSTGVARVDSFSGGTTGLTPSSPTTGAVVLGGALGVGNGGTGLTATPVAGQIPIGTGTGYALAQLTGGTGVTITNGAGTVTISAPGTGGTVTSVDVSGGTTGLTTSGGPVTNSGTITLAGTLAATNGGTGLTAPGANGNVLTSNGSAWVSQPLPTITGRLLNVQVFTSSGTYTRTSGATQAVVIARGGGGGGSGYFVCGCGTIASSGGNGGTTSFGSYVSAGGGSGVNGVGGGAGGTGGTGAIFAIRGTPGVPSQGSGSGPGAGEGGGTSVNTNNNSPGIAGERGGGGSSTRGGPTSGGGGQGEFALDYITAGLTSTVAVTIGAGGAGGSGSPGGFNGGNGGAGYVIVYEYS